MKLLHTSDWHIGRSLFEFSLLDDQREIFEQICSIVRSEQVDAVLISGDLYDRSLPSADAVQLLDHIFTTLTEQIGVPVLAISGNHDSGSRVSYGSRMLEKSGLYLAGGFSSRLKKVTLHDSMGPVHFFLLPYFLPQQVRLALSQEEPEQLRTASACFAALLAHNADQIDSTQRNVLLAHGFFICTDTPVPVCNGGETAVGTSDLCDLSPAEVFDYVALGHLHRPQTAGSPKMRYSGSPLKYAVDEAGSEKSVTLVELGEKGELSVRLLPLRPKRDLRVITGSCDQLCDPSLASDDYVFAQLISDGPVLGAIHRLRQIYPHTLGLRFQTPDAPALTQTVQDPASLPPQRLFELFYQQVQGEECDPQRMKLVEELFSQLEHR